MLWPANYLFLGAEIALGTVRLGLFTSYVAVMPNRIRIIRHEAVPKCGSFEVRFADGRKSRFFYLDDVLARRLRPTCSPANRLEQAKAFARAERDKAG